MATEYSINVDWEEDKWEIAGREAIASLMRDEGTRQHKEVKREAEEIGCDLETLIDEKADENYPMMNYAYPLWDRPSDEAIIKICEETNCTVAEDTETGDFYLALTGGGMNLSQDIALAYIIAQDHIPPALALEVSTQEGLSTHGKEWLKIMRYCRKSLLVHARGYRSHAKRILEAMREYRERKALEKPSER